MRINSLNFGVYTPNRAKLSTVGFKKDPKPDKATMLREAEQDLIRQVTDFDSDNPAYEDFIYYNPVYREGLKESDLLKHYREMHSDPQRDHDPDDPCYEDYIPYDPQYRY